MTEEMKNEPENELKRPNIRLTDEIVTRIDTEAGRLGLTRNALITMIFARRYGLDEDALAQAMTTPETATA